MNSRIQLTVDQIARLPNDQTRTALIAMMRREQELTALRRKEQQRRKSIYSQADIKQQLDMARVHQIEAEMDRERTRIYTDRLRTYQHQVQDARITVLASRARQAA